MPLIIAIIVAIVLRARFDFAYWQVALAFVATIIVLSILSQITKQARNSESGSSPAKPARKTTRQGQIEHIQNRLSVKEPIRASLIDVVKEAHALRTMVTRAGSYEFAFENSGASLAPAEFLTRSDQAIDIALDLTDRFGIVAKSAKGRTRSQRTEEAIALQQKKIDHLKDALEYSRSTIEVLILTKGEGDRTAEKLARSLSNLSDALEESWTDGFDQLEDPATTSALPEPKTTRLLPEPTTGDRPEPAKMPELARKTELT